MERACLIPGCVRPWYAKGFCNAHYLLARKHPDETVEQLALRAHTTRGKGPLVRTAAQVREQLLRSYVETQAGCWEWHGATDRSGYGNLRWGPKLWGVHRLAYHLLVAPVPDGIEVCHDCDNPPCFRPEHLFLGTHQENMLDAAAKGLMAGNGH
jgi:hypothetical protein